MGEVTTVDGGDPTKSVLSSLEDNAKEITMDAMDAWFSEAQDHLVAAAEQRAGGGAADDSEGMVSRRNNDLSNILNSFEPPEWDHDEMAWIFSVTHAAAVFHEFGAPAHVIKARMAEALAFQWPDAPQEVVDQFTADGENRNDWDGWVFFDEVKHPGTPAIGFIRYGREQARKRLRDEGFSVVRFEGGS